MTGGWNRTPWARYLLVTLEVQKNWYPPTEAKLAGSLLMWYGISDNNPIFYYDTPNLCPSLFPWTPPTQSVQQPEGSYLYQILWLCHIPTLRYQWGKIAITLTDNHLKAKHKFICDIYSEAKLHHYRGLQKWPTFSVQYLSSIYLHKTQVTQPQKPVSGSGYSWQSL